ncbi:helix-turn-helix domain-containing protein [Leucobacter sp. M11]|uniref:helix-turn-helix domain-containing protein n=1 Tax=Leucobacter sp. M11 TaxID=2993565 RepID=UPI002D7F6F8D|nr:helix-turn-helix transcriptional regulator [Leucobacter sp. M11]MEB4614042.1 helix-turn-helix transcriptional regulator [Leucobacter sp. M11]
MENKTPWQRFLTRTTDGMEQKDVAERTGISAATISRWFGKDTGTAEAVITIARAFGDSPTLALVETGFLSYQEATKGDFSPEELLARFDELDLAREIVRRLETGEANEALTDLPDETSASVIVGRFGETGTLPEGFDPEADLPHAAYDDTEEPGLPEEP